MKIEDILKKLIEANEDEVSQLYPDGREVLLNYIADLQRKEYNNSKAIENCKKSIESINEKLKNNKEPFEVVDGKIIYLNDYQVCRLKAIEFNQIVLNSDYVYSQDEIAQKNLNILEKENRI